MTTRTSTTRKSSSGAGKSTKSTRASRKQSAAKPAKSAAEKTARRTLKVKPKADAPKVDLTTTTTASLTTSDTTPAAKPVDPMVVREVTPVVTGTTLRKKELIEAVTERSGVKRRDAKAALEAALVILGEAIAEGQQINLPGLGKLKVTRTKKLANGEVFMTRIRQPIITEKTDDDEAGESEAKSEPIKAKDPLAEAAE